MLRDLRLPGLTGSVTVEARANLSFDVIARGDIGTITIGKASNIQDAVILHTDEGLPLRIGEQVAVGYGSVVHGGIVEVSVLIGMHATILSGARIGSGAMIGAGTAVLEHQEIPERSVAVGAPARVLRSVEQRRGRATCLQYVQRVERYRQAKGVQP